jgi:hypothetical protein
MVRFLGVIRSAVLEKDHAPNEESLKPDPRQVATYDGVKELALTRGGLKDDFATRLVCSTVTTRAGGDVVVTPPRAAHSFSCRPVCFVWRIVNEIYRWARQ